MNARPRTPCIKFAMSGNPKPSEMYDGERMAEVAVDLALFHNSLSFKSAYEQYNDVAKGQRWVENGLSLETRVDSHPPFSNYVPGWKEWIDYIFYTDE